MRAVASDLDAGKEAALKEALDRAIQQLASIQGDSPMVFGVVDQDAVARLSGTGPAFPLAGWSKTRSRAS